MENRISQSPLPVKNIVVTTIDFPDAMRQVITGKKVTRKEWGNKEIYCFLNAEFLSLHKEDGLNYKWVINDGDMIAKDWIVL